MTTQGTLYQMRIARILTDFIGAYVEMSLAYLVSGLYPLLLSHEDALDLLTRLFVRGGPL